ELATAVAGPADGTSGGQGKLAARRLRQFARARSAVAGPGLLRASSQSDALGRAGRAVGRKSETFETANDVTFGGYFTCFRDFTFQGRILAQPPHQDAGAAIDKASREAFMQGIR